jgi:hypothetical protein
MRGEGSVGMGTVHEQGTKVITTVHMVITFLMTAAMSGEAFGAAAKTEGHTPHGFGETPSPQM